MNDSIDYSPLALYSKLFLFFRLIRRIKMIVVRILWALVVIAILGAIAFYYIWANQQLDKPVTDREGYSYSSSYRSDGETYDVSWVLPTLLLIGFGPFIITMVMMGTSWSRFAQANGFKILSEEKSRGQAMDVMKVPSFRGKLLAVSLMPIQGRYKNMDFTLHTRQYKEGGVLRWRERQMDTILTLLLPADLPHIVINARGNEKARRSNLSQSFPAEHRFQFEGPLGANYDVYAEPSARIVTLQLFTPDVVQVLYDKLPTADIELKGGKVWIVQRYGVLDERLARTMVEAADELYGQLEKQLRVAGLLTANLNTSVQ
jgi:hypothetical protein